MPEEETEKPSLCWKINETEYTLTFGYLNNEPTAALFIKDKPEIMALIPQEVLGIAFNQGWGQPEPDYFNAFKAFDKYMGRNNE